MQKIATLDPIHVSKWQHKLQYIIEMSCCHKWFLAA